MGLTNEEFADLELLTAIDREERSTTVDLSTVLSTPVRDVASRLAWMSRMKLIERTMAASWILTPQGHQVLNGRSEDIMAIREVASRARRSQTMSWVMRREMRRDL